MTRNAVLTTTHLMPRRAPLRADSLPVLFCCSRRQPTSTPEGVVILLQISDQSLRTIWQCTGDTPCLPRASGSRQHLTFSPCIGPDGAAVETFAKQGPTAGIFWPKLETTMLLLRVSMSNQQWSLLPLQQSHGKPPVNWQFTTRIGGVAGGVWRLATTQLGGAHALPRISGFPVYLRLYFDIFCFRTFIIFSFARSPTSFFLLFFYFYNVL